MTSVLAIGSISASASADCKDPQKYTVCSGGDFPTIQAAMNPLSAVAACDTVEVCDGLFSIGTEIVFKSGVILRSKNGKNSTVLERIGGRGRLLRVNGVAPGSQIGTDSDDSGFTFRLGDPPSGQNGGAITITNSSFAIQHCAFDSNTVTNARGGAVHASPGISNSFSMEFCSFQGNLAVLSDTLLTAAGGAAYVKNCNDVTVSNCMFVDNHSDCGTANPANCISPGQLPRTSGGGLMAEACKDLIVTDCTFDSNSSFDAGGFNYWTGSGPAVAPLLIHNNTFTNNHAGRNGGAFGFDHGDWGLSKCRFESNTADSAGGAIFVLDTTGFIRDSDFLRNGVVGSGDSKYFNGGGAIGLRASGGAAETDTFSIESCRFDSCYSASDGGTIYLAESYEFQVTGCTINAGQAAGHGGGIYVGNTEPCVACDDDTVFVDTSIIRDCSADGNGGGIFVSAGNAVLDNVLLVRNDAAQGGGVYYRENQLDPVAWTNLTLVGNAGEGAAIFLKEDIDIAIESSVFSDNDGGTDDIVEIEDLGSVDATFSCCDWYGNSPTNAPVACDSCFTANPQFCGPETDDFMIVISSPCNAGYHPDDRECGIVGIMFLCEFLSADHTWLDEANPIANYSSTDTLRVGAYADTAVGLPSFSDVTVLNGARVDSAMLSAEVYRLAGSGSDSLSVHACLQPTVIDEASWNVFRTGSTWGMPGAGRTNVDYDDAVLGGADSFSILTADTLALSTELGEWVVDEVWGNYPVGRGRLVIRPRGTMDTVFYNLTLRLWSTFE